jgi:hypothetical protein
MISCPARTCSVESLKHYCVGRERMYISASVEKSEPDQQSCSLSSAWDVDPSAVWESACKQGIEQNERESAEARGNCESEDVRDKGSAGAMREEKSTCVRR